MVVLLVLWAGRQAGRQASRQGTRYVLFLSDLGPFATCHKRRRTAMGGNTGARAQAAGAAEHPLTWYAMDTSLLMQKSTQAAGAAEHVVT
jgi:hypothetical protein